MNLKPRYSPKVLRGRDQTKKLGQHVDNITNISLLKVKKYLPSTRLYQTPSNSKKRGLKSEKMKFQIF